MSLRFTWLGLHYFYNSIFPFDKKVCIPVKQKKWGYKYQSSKFYTLYFEVFMAKNTLVCQYLENVSRNALGEYADIIKKYVKGRNGIYALYSNDKLYYVGLASNLRARLKSHLKDKHADTWDRFSVYLTHKNKHLKELETLLLRVIKPKGNLVKGKLKKAENLLKILKQDVRFYHNEKLDDIFNITHTNCQHKKTSKKRKGKPKIKKSKAALAPYIKKAFRIRMKYKGKTHTARVSTKGIITIRQGTKTPKRLKGKKFYSPSMAAIPLIDGNKCNGWFWWKYKDKSGKWVVIDNLRK